MRSLNDQLMSMELIYFVWEIMWASFENNFQNRLLLLG